MFECQVCGLLSLKGPSCPGCGSQLRTDLSLTLDDDDFVPTEVPGLEDAADSWYELEGKERPAEEVSTVPASVEPVGSLPFGYQGQSNTFQPNLLFGIGSFANGMPFTGAGEALVEAPSVTPSPVMSAPVTRPLEPKQPAPRSSPSSRLVPGEMATVPLPTSAPRRTAPASHPEPDATPVPLPTSPSMELESVPLPIVTSQTSLGNPKEVTKEGRTESVLDQAGAVAITAPNTAPVPPPPSAPESPPAPVRLVSSRLVEQGTASTDSQEETFDEGVPDYWRIDAPIPDYTTIYETPEEVVEVVHDSEEADVVVYQHEAVEAAAVFHSPLEASELDQRSSGFKLQLHPAQALAVDVGGDAEHNEWVKQGYAGLASSNWGAAARSFQQLAGQRPQDPSVLNNYGISLLQRAIGMAEATPGEHDPTVSAQFESAILALREAAKADPTNGDILVNLAHALIESGRSEKALGIINVHNQRSPGDAKGLNTQAVALSQLGQMAQAMEVLKAIEDDDVASKNLAQFTG